MGNSGTKALAVTLTTESYIDKGQDDDLARMILALLSETWILRDRVTIMEELLEKKNVLNVADIDNYIPDRALTDRLDKLRLAMVGAVVGAPLAARDRSVKSILDRAAASSKSE